MSWKSRVTNLLLHRIGPSETALLEWLAPRLEDSLLLTIARADYGLEQDENFEALRRIRDSRRVSTPLDWVPLEVLNLTRWCEPDDPTQNPAQTRSEGHRIRAFACAILLRADSPEAAPFNTSENETLIQMIASVLSLSKESAEIASRFLCWRILRMPLYADESAFFVFGLLLLRAALFEPGQDGAELKVLADWAVREERHVRCGVLEFSESEQWLLGLTCHSQRHVTWQNVARNVLLDPGKRFPNPAAPALKAIARRLDL